VQSDLCLKYQGDTRTSNIQRALYLYTKIINKWNQPQLDIFVDILKATGNMRAVEILNKDHDLVRDTPFVSMLRNKFDSVFICRFLDSKIRKNYILLQSFAF